MPGFNEVIERLRRSTVRIADGAGAGSGVVWDANGTVITNAHVARSDAIEVVDFSGRRLSARVVRRDRERDLALVETREGALESAVVGDPGSIRPGEIAVAVGHPLGVTGAAAWGIIHSVGPLDLGSRRTWIQADIRLAPGNSGGALANAAGEVIGINTMVYNGLGLAAPVDEVAAFARGHEDRVRLGLEMLRTRQGLIVTAIEPGSLAEHAGVITGDVIECSPEQLRRLLGGVKQFGSAEITVVRGGRTRILRVHTQAANGARAA